MKCEIFIIILAVFKESHPLNPEILKYDQFMKNFETTGRRLKEEAAEKIPDGVPVMKRESGSSEYDNVTKREPGNREVEAIYKELYPASSNLDDWPEIKNLTARFLKELCSHVVVNLTGSLTTEDRLGYNYTKTKEFPPERLLRRAPVKFPEGIRNMTLLQCSYYVLSFYLARGGEESVFRLSKDKKQGVFYLESGLHPVKYHQVLNTTHYILEPDPWTFKQSIKF